MSEPVTRSELSQVLDAIQGMQASLQAIEKKLDIHIATSGERFQRLENKIDAVEAKLEQRINAVEAKLEQRINAVEAKLEQRISAVEAQLSQRISAVETQLGQRIDTVETTLQQIVKRQDGTDARLWGFLVTLLVLAAGLITKLLFFDTPRL
ncbi:hypothetical protein RHP47_04860 [Thermosynechococcus sp. QKsg1]|uniref:hypothetical protein n=1 Tax=unclassified Thermosynechococcus TaxID=2622553 RepID=UPI0016813925|nr:MULTISPECIES: hypothetical protein [unclassified Thermosynechococcus]WJI25016.1 apolipoprotein A1/A4/E family protein [Thermosynechococcus sp. B0]WJI27540.1 apolipoprotein A1/A4/E family protein [Thermosynechococcus sp. B1]WJI30072.1 apolipoprotein A1/A4/E family protein [Thermosynechococcus sp. B3]WKT84658.1 hypothetical protein QYC28_04865 [Thermosynechococcus sp. HY596]WNC63793.1 hypothetical protein RHK13_04865 [Thermosynechococcus sp. HY591]